MAVCTVCANGTLDPNHILKAGQLSCWRPGLDSKRQQWHAVGPAFRSVRISSLNGIHISVAFLWSDSEFIGHMDVRRVNLTQHVLLNLPRTEAGSYLYMTMAMRGKNGFDKGSGSGSERSNLVRLAAPHEDAHLCCQSLAACTPDASDGQSGVWRCQAALIVQLRCVLSGNAHSIAQLSCTRRGPYWHDRCSDGVYPAVLS